MVTREHLDRMKNSCIVCNMGHSNTEIDVVRSSDSSLGAFIFSLFPKKHKLEEEAGSPAILNMTVPAELFIVCSLTSLLAFVYGFYKAPSSQLSHFKRVFFHLSLMLTCTVSHFIFVFRIKSKKGYTYVNQYASQYLGDI